MAAPLNPFIQVIDTLNRAGVRYVIVGGFAAVMHGSNRVTTDLDLVIDLRLEEARKTIDREEIEWPKGFDGARVASLLHFASLTPDQRLQWMCDTLAFIREIRLASASPEGISVGHEHPNHLNP